MDIVPLDDLETTKAEFRHLVAGAIRPDVTLVLHPNGHAPRVVLGIDPKVNPTAYQALSTECLCQLVGVHKPAQLGGVGYDVLHVDASGAGPGLAMMRLVFDAFPDVPLLLDNNRHHDVLTAMAGPHTLVLMDGRHVDKLATVPADEAVAALDDEPIHLHWEIPEADTDLKRTLTAVGKGQQLITRPAPTPPSPPWPVVSSPDKPLLTLVGTLTRNPQLRYSPAGVALADLVIAVEQPDRPGDPEHYGIIVFQAMAEHVGLSLQEGDRVVVVGTWDTEPTADDTTQHLVTAEAIGPDLRFSAALPLRTPPPDWQMPT